MDNLYIHVASDASMEIYFQNLPSDFRIRPPQVLALGDAFEVGLVDITYFNSFYNVHKNSSPFTIVLANDTKYIECSIHPCYYKIIPLLKAITLSFKNEMKRAGNPLERGKIEFIFNPNSRRVGIHHKSILSMRLSSNLAQLMGFEAEYIRLHEAEAFLWSKNVIDQDVGNDFFYLYSDMVDFSITSDTHTRILRMIHREENFGDIIHRGFQNIVYCKIRKTELDEIHFQLKGEDNGLIKFYK